MENADTERHIGARSTRLFLRRSSLGRLRCRRRPACDWDFPTIAHLLPHGKLNLEHAVIELRFGLLDIRAFRQRDLAVELARAPLGAVHALFILLVLVLALALDGERAIGNFDSDILGLQTGQFCTDLELAVELINLDCGASKQQNCSIRD